MRRCPRCRKRPSRKHSSYCAVCHNEYMKKWYRRHPESTNLSVQRRKKAIRDLIRREKKKPCADCHTSYPYYVMDFDHCRGKKLLNLSVAVSKTLSLEAVREEIAKCDVVCANCHRERSFKRAA